MRVRPGLIRDALVVVVAVLATLVTMNLLDSREPQGSQTLSPHAQYYEPPETRHAPQPVLDAAVDALRHVEEDQLGQLGPAETHTEPVDLAQQVRRLLDADRSRNTAWADAREHALTRDLVTIGNYEIERVRCMSYTCEVSFRLETRPPPEVLVRWAGDVASNCEFGLLDQEENYSVAFYCPNGGSPGDRR